MPRFSSCVRAWRDFSADRIIKFCPLFFAPRTIEGGARKEQQARLRRKLVNVRRCAPGEDATRQTLEQVLPEGPRQNGSGKMVVRGSKERENCPRCMRKFLFFVESTKNQFLSKINKIRSFNFDESVSNEDKLWTNDLLTRSEEQSTGHKAAEQIPWSTHRPARRQQEERLEETKAVRRGCVIYKSVMGARWYGQREREGEQKRKNIGSLLPEDISLLTS